MKIISKVTLSQQLRYPPPRWTKNSFVTFKKGMGFIKKNPMGVSFATENAVFF